MRVFVACCLFRFTSDHLAPDHSAALLKRRVEVMATVLLVLCSAAVSASAQTPLSLRQTPLKGTTQGTGLSRHLKTSTAQDEGPPQHSSKMASRVAGFASTGDPIFSFPASYDSGGTGTVGGVAVGDFNGDGKPDLAVANLCMDTCDAFTGSGSVGVLLGNGDGTYQPAQVYNSGGIQPYSVVAADFNGDGKLDLAVLNYGLVVVFLGKGDGTFQTGASYVCGNGNTFYSMVVADFNGDGKADLAVLDAPGFSLTILLGNGDGTFQTINDDVGAWGEHLAAGDFNGDGKMDLAITTEGTNLVSVVLGYGDGTFKTAVKYPSGGFAPDSIAVGDFNGDGKPDLVVANLCSDDSNCATPSSVGILLGNGDGTFQTTVSYLVGADGGGARSVAVGDFNGDNKPDLAIVTQQGPDILSVLTNRGDGTFLPVQNYGFGFASFFFVSIADLNGDGNLDLAISNDSFVYVVMGKRDGTFDAPASYDFGAATDGQAVVGDFNNDGSLDLAVAGTGLFGLFLGNGNGSFQAGVTKDFTGDTPLFATADFNRDGELDLVLGTKVYLGNGNGTFQAGLAYVSDTGPGAVGDFNGDGNPDLAVATGSALGVLLGKGNGTFGPEVNYQTSGLHPTAVVVGDFNGDGRLDLAMANSESKDDDWASDGSINVLLGNGDGTFQAATIYDSGGTDPTSLAIGDFNGDGKTDLVVANAACAQIPSCGGTPNLSVFLGNGDGTFQKAVNYPSGASPILVAVADFNGDGKPDLVAQNYSVFGSGIVTLLGNGDGSFQPAVGYDVPGAFLVVGDFDGDGKPDLALTSGTVLLNVAADPFLYATTTTLTPSSNPSFLGHSVTLTATAKSSAPLPLTGNITFREGATSLATLPISSGQAKYSTSALTAGTHLISAMYSGDSNFVESTSAVLRQAVQGPDFSVSVSALAPPSVTPGQSASASVKLTSLGGYANSVALTCSVSPASALPLTCSLNPPSIMLVTSGSTDSTLTVNTKSAAATEKGPRPPEP